MTYKNEQSLINIIKYSPLIFIVTVSIIITGFLYLDKQITFQKEKILVSNEFIKTNKERIKTDVDDLYEFIIKTQEETENKLKKNIQNRVYEAHSIAMRIYNENKDKKSKEEIIKIIKDALVDIRFNNGRGYFFIYSFDYECILLPVNRKNEGGSVRDFQDSNGMYLGREIVNSLKDKDEAFLTWYYPKPNEPNSSYKKIGFNIHFEPYNWFIGTGEYFVDFEENMKKELDITKINQIWSQDFTHLYYKWIEFYLATVIDEFNKEIIWYSIALHHENSLILEALNMAVRIRNITPDYAHSDQWSEYRSYEYFSVLERYRISASMSKKSSPWENWAQESFYWKFKFELWNLNRFDTFAEAIEAVILQIHYYNNFRIHTSLKMTPVQFAKLNYPF